MSALSLTGARARLGGRVVLDGIDLAVERGCVTALLGPNGAGKTSVLRAMLGLLPLSAGKAEMDGRPLDRLSPSERAAAAAYLPQERRIAWNMPAVKIAALGAALLGGDEALRRAQAALSEVDAAHLADRGVADMSGGERARVLLARALAAPARALLADEPIAALDPDAQMMVLDRLTARARGGQAVLVSLHDLALAARYADRVVVLHEGRIAMDGPPREALSSDVLDKVFGLSGRWIEDGQRTLLLLDRR